MVESRRPDLHHPGKRNIHHQISKQFQRYHFGQLRPHPIGYRRKLPEISGRNSSGIRTRRGQGLRIHQHGPDPLRNRTRHTHQPLSIHRSGPRVRLFLRIHRHGGLLRKRDRQLRRSRSIVFIHQSERILSGYQKTCCLFFARPRCCIRSSRLGRGNGIPYQRRSGYQLGKPKRIMGTGTNAILFRIGFGF